MTEVVRVHLALLFTSLIYGFFFIFIKLLLTEISQETLIYMRLVFSAVIMASIEWGLIRTRFLNWGDFLKTMGLGLIGVFIVQILLILGVRLTTTFHASLLMATIPLMTLLLGFAVRQEAYKPKKLLGMVLSFAGVSLLLGNQGSVANAPNVALGDAIILANAACFSIYLIATKPLLARYNAFSLTSYAYIVSAILAACLAPSLNLTLLPDLSPTGWLLIVYTVIFASIGTYALNNYALSKTSASTVAVYIFLQPAISALFGHWILGEPWGSWMLLAGGLIFAGVVVATRS
jgi:drug/metabolite transporter (DMT)-like permease